MQIDPFGGPLNVLWKQDLRDWRGFRIHVYRKPKAIPFRGFCSILLGKVLKIYVLGNGISGILRPSQHFKGKYTTYFHTRNSVTSRLIPGACSVFKKFNNTSKRLGYFLYGSTTYLKNKQRITGLCSCNLLFINIWKQFRKFALKTCFWFLSILKLMEWWNVILNFLYACIHIFTSDHC